MVRMAHPTSGDAVAGIPTGGGVLLWEGRPGPKPWSLQRCVESALRRRRRSAVTICHRSKLFPMSGTEMHRMKALLALVCVAISGCGGGGEPPAGGGEAPFVKTATGAPAD